MKTTSYLSARHFQTSGDATSPSEFATPKLWDSLTKFWHALTVVDVDPQIRQESDRHGNSQWRVYDPITNKIWFFDSEDDVCVWLEQRYYA